MVFLMKLDVEQYKDTLQESNQGLVQVQLKVKLTYTAWGPCLTRPIFSWPIMPGVIRCKGPSYTVKKIFSALSIIQFCLVEWSDLALLAIFEIGHIAVDQVYFYV